MYKQKIQYYTIFLIHKILFISVPRPVFQTKKIFTHPKIVEEEVLTPQHEEIVKYINDCKYFRNKIINAKQN